MRNDEFKTDPLNEGFHMVLFCLAYEYCVLLSELIVSSLDPHVVLEGDAPPERHEGFNQSD